MARGFERKDVEFQQAEAAEREPPGRRALTAEQRDDASKRQTLALTLTRARAELAAASSPHHRQMLQVAIAETWQQGEAMRYGPLIRVDGGYGTNLVPAFDTGPDAAHTAELLALILAGS